MANLNSRPTTVITNLAIAFKKATAITEDADQAKKEHRGALKGLIDQYYEDVKKNKAEGIRTAKELVEIVKLDLLLMGEATDRTDTGTLDEVRFQRIQEQIDPDDPAMQVLLESMFKAMNGANDEMDTRANVRVSEPTEVIDVEPSDRVDVEEQGEQLGMALDQ